MLLNPQQGRAILGRIDPGRLYQGRPVGLRDGALLALAAAGLTSPEIATLRASAITMDRGSLRVSVDRLGITWVVILPADLGARLLSWLTERRLWAVDEPVFTGGRHRWPLTPLGVRKVLLRYYNALRQPAPRRRRRR